MRATLLNDDEEALKQLRAKEEKKMAKEEKKKKGDVKRKTVAKKRKAPAKRTHTDDSNEEDDPEPIQMQLDDSSEYSEEFQEEQDDLTTLQYPFAAKEPEVIEFYNIFLIYFFR